mgnify:CR=1 FL=1
MMYNVQQYTAMCSHVQLYIRYVIKYNYEQLSAEIYTLTLQYALPYGYLCCMLAGGDSQSRPHGILPLGIWQGYAMLGFWHARAMTVRI